MNKDQLIKQNRSRAKEVGAKFKITIMRGGKIMKEFYFLTKVGADAFLDGELRGKGTVTPLE